MHRFFTSNMKIQHIYVLHGLGGAGKTQIALKFINESSSHFSDIFLIDTSTIMTIETGLKNIAVVKDFGDSPQDGLLWLTSKVEEWLLFFDNADDPSMDLNNFIPQCNHGNIIITSRNPGLCVYAGSHSLVSDMEEEDAVALLLKSAAQEATTCTEQIATEIVKNQAQLLSQKPAQSHDRYAWTVYTTWQMSFNQLKPLAATFLQLCSFLYHKGISEEIFSYASEYISGPSKKELQEPWEFLSHFLGPLFLHVTNEIKAYSLISFDAEKKLFSIHPLVHAWRQETVHNPETYKSTMGSILGMAISRHTQQSIQLAGLILLPHVELAVQMKAKVALVFKAQYGRIFWKNGKYRQAEKLLEEVLEKQKQLLGENHPDTLRTMGIWPTHTQTWESIKKQENSRPPCIPWVIWPTHTHLGEHQKAGELNGIVLEKRKQLLGENHPDTLRTMGNLAITYSHLGEHQKAGELNAIVLEKQKQLLGENHPDTLRTMGNLATYTQTWESIKKQENSRVLCWRNRNSFWVKIIQTPCVPWVIWPHILDLGEHQKAGELNAIVLEKLKQLLGENHPHPAYMGNLANTYSPGRASKSRRTHAIVLEKLKQLLGENHPAPCVPWVIWPSHTRPGRASKSKRTQCIVLEKQKQFLGNNHPDTLHTWPSYKAKEIKKLISSSTKYCTLSAPVETIIYHLKFQYVQIMYFL
ncbi:hypothetical protein B0H13DRAFT_2268514 [Mycena leptocephala]|nr:hypothetical protein B0H13DRAFT_2268514 [Mycena leptocephala]